ncbi:MAG: DUF4440 domain-containing protein [bacterium]
MRTIVLFVILSVWCLSLSAQSDESSIRKVLINQVEAWNQGDVEGYMKGYWESDSLIFVSGGTQTRGYANTLERYKKGYDTKEKMGTLTFSELMIRQVTPALAVVTGIWRLKRVQDEPWGRFTLLVEKKPQGWRVTYDHTSSASK